MKKAVSVYFAGALSLVFAPESAALNSQKLQKPSSEASVDADVTVVANTLASNTKDNSHDVLNSKLENSELADSELHALLSTMSQFRASFEQTVVDAQQNTVH